MSSHYLCTCTCACANNARLEVENATNFPLVASYLASFAPDLPYKREVEAPAL